MIRKHSKSNLRASKKDAHTLRAIVGVGPSAAGLKAKKGPPIRIDEIKRGQIKLEQTVPYTEGILETMQEPLLVLDKNLRVKTANRAFYNLFLTSATETEGVLIYKLGSKQWNTPQLRTALEKILPQKSSVRGIEITFNSPLIGQKVMLLNGQKLVQHDEKEELILLTIEDITDHRLLERNDTFVSVASHELKTPVTTVKTLVQLLQRRFEKSNDKLLVEYLAKIGEQVNQLTNLVSNLLDVSKIRLGKLELDESLFLIDDLVEEIVAEFRLLSPRRMITRRSAIQAKVYGDRYRISQVLINIISNAIKYSPETSRIIVTCIRSTREVIVSVQDFGIGIKRSDQSKIFERFFQVENKVGRNLSGLGIGLYISAAMMERHGGRIWVESKGKGRGSTFFVALPLWRGRGRKRKT